MGNTNTRRGFTLIELLIVVLIIGVLAAIAVPQYQKAVMKSRFSALMPIAKSIANGNEVYYMEHGTYASNPTSLDVAGKDEKYPDGTELDMSAGDYSFVRAGRDNHFPMNYIVYQKHSGKFADNIHCEANENNTMAQEVCQSLGGQYIPGSQSDGFVTYVLSGTQTAQDTLPTSMNKLKKQICGTQFDDDHCIVDEVAQTVTTKECGTAIKYKGSTYGSGRSHTGTGCLLMTYDAQGNYAGEEAHICDNSYGKLQDGSCVPTQGAGNSFETLYDETGRRIAHRSCATYDVELEGCVRMEETYYPVAGGREETRRICVNQSIMDPEGMICPDGYRDGEYKAYDKNSQEIAYKVCVPSAIDVNTGACTQYSREEKYDRQNDGSYLKTNCTSWENGECVTWVNSEALVFVYDENGIKTGQNRIQCLGGSVGANGCQGFWSQNQYPCTKEVNWETATCL